MYPIGALSGPTAQPPSSRELVVQFTQAGHQWCRSYRRPSSSSCWRCPRRHLSRYTVQFSLPLRARSSTSRLPTPATRRSGVEHCAAELLRAHRDPSQPVPVHSNSVCPSSRRRSGERTKRISRRRLRLQEDPTPTSTSPRSAISALTTDSMEAEGV